MTLTEKRLIIDMISVLKHVPEETVYMLFT